LESLTDIGTAAFVAFAGAAGYLLRRRIDLPGYFGENGCIEA
jgi:hypothetical protein